MPVIFRDDFSSVISASWTKTDTTSKLSIVNGRMFANGGLGSPAWGDPGLRDASRTRATLGGFAALLRLTNQGGQGPALGLQPITNPTNPAVNGSGLYFDYPDLKTAGGARINPLDLRMRSIDYLFTVVARAGAGYLVGVSVPTNSAGGPYAVFPSATLVWVEDSGSDTNVYPMLWNRDGFWYADYATVLDSAELTGTLATKWGAATAADDYARANATLSGNTAFGAKAYTFSSMLTPSIVSNALSGADGAGFFINAGTPGTVAHVTEVSLTTPAGARGIEILFRGDGGMTNVLGAYFEATDCGIWNYAISGPVTGGAQTGAVTLPASTFCRLRVVDYGTAIRMYLNDQDVLGLITTSSLNTGTYCGVHVYNAAHTVDDFAVWPSTITLPANFGPLPAVPVGSGAAVSSDAFTAANGTTLPTYNAAWTIRSGTWNIQSNQARMTAAGVNGVATRSTGTAGVNHEARADITLPSTTPTYPLDWYAAVFARWTDASNYVMARFLYQNSSNEVELWENNAGAQALIGYINLGTSVLAPSSTHNIRLAVNGNEASAWFDGEVVVQARTAVTTGSNAGIGVNDSNPNGQPSWDLFEIRVAGAADVTPPVISAIAAGTLTTTGATITWTTDELADTQIQYGLTTGYGTTTTLINTSPMVTSHSQAISGLASNTLYHYRVLSRDASGNLQTSGDNTFTTLSAGGAPVISAVASSAVTSSGFTVTWTTDIASDSQVEYGTTVAYGSSTTLAPALVTSHSVNVSGLTANTLYHYRARSAA